MADETAKLLTDAAARHELADRHEAEALLWAVNFDQESIGRAAHHFTIAAALRGRARWRTGPT